MYYNQGGEMSIFPLEGFVLFTVVTNLEVTLNIPT